MSGLDGFVCDRMGTNFGEVAQKRKICISRRNRGLFGRVAALSKKMSLASGAAKGSLQVGARCIGSVLDVTNVREAVETSVELACFGVQKLWRKLQREDCWNLLVAGFFEERKDL